MLAVFSLHNLKHTRWHKFACLQ